MSGAVVRVVPGSFALPALFSPDPQASKRFVEFFTANIRNPNTRKAYVRAATEFAAWCQRNGLTELRDIEPVHVAAYIEELQSRLAAPSVKLHLAGIRMLFDWLVIGQVIAVNRKRSDNYAPCGAREGVAGVDQEFLRSTRQGSSAS